MPTMTMVDDTYAYRARLAAAKRKKEKVEERRRRAAGSGTWMLDTVPRLKAKPKPTGTSA